MHCCAHEEDVCRVYKWIKDSRLHIYLMHVIGPLGTILENNNALWEGQMDVYMYSDYDYLLHNNG